MDSIKLYDYKRLKETLEIAGLNDKQVQHIMKQIEYAFGNSLYALKDKTS